MALGNHRVFSRALRGLGLTLGALATVLFLMDEVALTPSGLRKEGGDASSTLPELADSLSAFFRVLVDPGTLSLGKGAVQTQPSRR